MAVDGEYAGVYGGLKEAILSRVYSKLKERRRIEIKSLVKRTNSIGADHRGSEENLVTPVMLARSVVGIIATLSLRDIAVFWHQKFTSDWIPWSNAADGSAIVIVCCFRGTSKGVGWVPHVMFVGIGCHARSFAVSAWLKVGGLD